NTVDLFKALGDFILNRLEIVSRVRTIGSLYGQFTNTLQIVIDFVQRAFSRLSDRNTIVRVTACLGQPLDVSREAVSNRLTSSVVLGAVDAQTGRQALDSGAQGVLGLGQVVLRDQCQVIGVDDRHGLLLMGKGSGITADKPGKPFWVESWPFTWVSGRPCISCTCSLTAGV